MSIDPVNDHRSIARRLIVWMRKSPCPLAIAWSGAVSSRTSSVPMLVIPAALVLILAVLLATLHSMRASVIILANIPFAMVGGIVSLWISGEYLSVPASVGFIALLGIAVLNGLVLVSCFRQLRDEGLTMAQAVRLGAERRLTFSTELGSR